MISMMSAILFRSSSLRFFGLPFGSWSFLMAIGFHSQIWSLANTCSRKADGRGRRWSEYGAGLVL